MHQTIMMEQNRKKKGRKPDCDAAEGAAEGDV